MKEMRVERLSMQVGDWVNERDWAWPILFCFVQGCPPKIVVVIAICLKLYFY
jgi:hypothetical protein